MDWFQEKEELGVSALYRLYRQALPEGSTVLLKSTEGAGQRKVAAKLLHSEYAACRELQLPGVIRPIDLREQGNDTVLVLEDPGGLPLDRLLLAGPLDLKLALRIAGRAAAALADLHFHGYIHCDIQPCNLLVDTRTGSVELHGLGMATQVPRSVRGVQAAGMLGTTPAYASPEFSGRTNRLMDYRTDLYSLGVTLFEMVTGKRPFEAEDPLEVIHFHAAKLPPVATSINPEVPYTVSQIINKLLSKPADDRYQGGRGLLHDLDRCLRSLEESGEVHPFQLAEHDPPSRFELPQRFYGRGKELRRLEAGLEDASRGTLRVMMVAGSTGVGKSSLVLELQRSVCATGGWFASGKYDAVDHGTPYSGILEGLRSLWRTLLTHEPERIAGYRQALKDALGQNLGVIVGMTPELASIVGETPPVPRLAATESKNRFQMSFQQTLKALATSVHPLVFFLDDLQWADQSSLELIEGALEKDMGNFMLVGAYCDGGTDERHPLLRSLARIEEKEIPVETVALGPLELSDVEQLVADALRTGVDRTAPQAAVVFRKTAGNAFFTRALLTDISERGLLKQDREGGWSWELPEIGALESSGDLVELATRRIEQMPAGIRRTVSLAAALGRHLDLENLALVCERTVEEVERDLVEACRERILLKHDQGYRFEHDRLQESAYSLIPEADRTQAHLRIGRLLWGQGEKDATGARKFAILSHMNRALDLLDQPAERRATALLNLKAGRTAKSAAAFPAAHQYFSCGLSLLGEDPWSRDYDLSLALHNEAAEAASLIADFREADRLVHEILAAAHGTLDRVSAYEIQIAIAHSRLRETEALSLALEAVRQLGVQIPSSPTMEEARASALRARQMAQGALFRDSDPDLWDSHAEKLAAMRLLARASLGAGMVNHPLYLTIAAKLFELSLEQGQSPEAPLAYVMTGGMLCYLLDDPEAGYRVGSRGMELLKNASPRLKAYCHFLFTIDIECWRRPSQDLVGNLIQAHRMGLDCGDFLSAGVSAYFCCELALISGMELPRLESFVSGYHAGSLHLGTERICAGLLRLGEVAKTLKNGAGGAVNGSAELIPSELGKAWHASADQTVQEVTACHEMMISCLYRQHDQALEVALRADALPIGAVAGLLPCDFYICLSILDFLQASIGSGEAKLLQIAAARQERLRLRAQACPVNYRHKLDLVEALRLRLSGETVLAMEFFDAAIAGARRNSFLHEEALANELAAEFYLSLGRQQIAAGYLHAAASAYRRWGSSGKLHQLHDRHPDCFLKRSSAAAAHFVGHPPEGEPEIGSGTVDMASIERAAATLSGELDLPRLLENLLGILLQNAGAQRGFLLREEEGTTFVEAYGSVDEEGVKILQRTPLEENERLSRSIVSYVSRTCETVVIGDATRDPRFSATPYVVRERPKSILCSSVLHRGKPVAILYLENNRSCDSFNADRLAAIQMISSQAGIALENARLLESMKQEVQTRRLAEEKLLQALDEVARLKDRLHAENAYLKEEMLGSPGFDEIVGNSELLKKVLNNVTHVATTDATVLILGETGTGKELIARAIHNRSHRKQNAMVRVNCATLPATLIESELFGHEKGAFTGAIARKVGRFELADGGTIFLDEIGELPLELQAKLLRVLQEGEFERLGSATTHKVNVRVIAATNRDLKTEVAEGRFRSDLYYRVSVFPIELPPLRNRSEDIPLLVWYFINKKQGELGKNIDKVPKETMDALRSYVWPGNIRELENVMERALILSRGRTLTLDDSLGVAPVNRFSHSSSANLDEVEKNHIISVLEQCQWKVKGKGNAAEKLGLNPSTLSFRMKKLGIERGGVNA